MKTSEFINILKENPKTILSFEYAPGQFVRPDFHITEVKNVDFDTVDCGGVANNWSETHVQLWENEVAEPGHLVDSSKAFKIFEVVNKVRSTYLDTEIKFEYDNPSFNTAVLPVASIVKGPEKIIVKLGSDHATCKAKDRANTKEERDQACCGPVKTRKPKFRLKAKEISCAAGTDCC
ncbi:DUF6428 family protein [Echinicola jeungdonensis]|uniref:DUF6428 family protein n=1 Tax=Echinicola jeungdonensis TaxID=709343 RepID=A0ABV5J948_9BACT|nr:DUF6428 family protein [Echinicola jeungdonensis]MDN3670546.1 DUF6428 family protein [Echinicola jeungdonensis]